MRRRKVLLPLAIVLTAGLAFGLYWFQPWKLFVDHRVDEALPTVAAAAATPSASTATLDAATPTPRTSAPGGATTIEDPVAPSPSSASTTPAKRGNVLLSRGSLITHEHDTSGMVQLVRLANGDRVLTLRDLDTSDGPDVEVWLTDAPVIPGEKGWYVFDDGAHVSLGDLKGNQGNQVYRIPESVDLSKYTSVSLWCARFDVSFGAASLTG